MLFLVFKIFFIKLRKRVLQSYILYIVIATIFKWKNRFLHKIKMYTIMIGNGNMNSKREKAHLARINYIFFEILL